MSLETTLELKEKLIKELLETTNSEEDGKSVKQKLVISQESTKTAVELNPPKSIKQSKKSIIKSVVVAKKPVDVNKEESTHSGVKKKESENELKTEDEKKKEKEKETTTEKEKKGNNGREEKSNEKR
ncbi:hypothetical protein Mgra_00000018 [Meloidogyne graminicola]|uniref:Uncharacterized protein n=1 Tax=Meloidogyne graminicola TaxID=189291 RepID=A0A8T0A265_9BILA|nr:hypothetical protein Mgra_00000018 [Meloidogyne graminicola]